MTDEQIEEILGKIEKARDAAEQEAGSVCDFVAFRGYQIIGMRENGERSEDYWGFPTAQEELSVADLRNVFDAAKQRPKVASLTIYVGYNGADTEDQLENNYEPEVGFEELEIWRR